MDVYEQMAARQTGATQPTAEEQQQANQTIPVIAQETRMKRLDAPEETQTFTQQQQQAPAAQFNEEAFFTEKSGGKFKSWDEINGALTKEPQVIKETAPLTFGNDTAKSIYDLLAAGKEDDLLPIFEKRIFAKKAKDLPDDELVIAHLQSQHGLTHDQAKRQFDRLYTVDENSVTNEADLAIDKTIANNKKKNDADKARQYFASTVEELKFPSAAPQQQEPVLTDSAKQVMSIGAEYSKKDVSAFPFEFAPQNSTLKVAGQISLPQEKVKELSNKIAENPEAFVAGFLLNRWYKADKTLDADAIARDMAFYDFAGDMMNQVAAKTHNQLLEARLRDEKNISESGGTNRRGADLTQTDQSPMEKFFRIPAEKKPLVV